MKLGRSALLAPLVRWAGRLRFPVLLALTVALLAVNVFVPDPIPLVDEAILALGALVLSRLRKRETSDEERGDEGREDAAQ
jgi:hypothetical protein